jgi:hypothetical protein
MDKISIWLILVIISTNNLYSQELITDRPDQTESSSTLPKGYLQLETGFSWESLQGDYPMDDIFHYQGIGINSTLLRFGVLHKFELRFGWDYLYEITRVERGTDNIIYEAKGFVFEPVYVGGKFQFSDEDGLIPEMAVLGHLGLPSLSIFEEPEQIQPDLSIAGSYTISSDIGFAFNVGLHWPGFGQGHPNLFYSAVMGISHGEKLSSFWEFYAFRHEILEDLVYYEAGFPPHDLRADFGFTYLFKPNIQLDLSGGLGFSKISPDFFISTGLSWRIPG